MNVKKTGFVYIALILMLTSVANATEIQWSRLRGKVKATNAKTQTLTIEDSAGDLLSLHIDAEVDVLDGKDPVAKFADLRLDEKVTLLYNPKPVAPKEVDEPALGGVYPPLH